MTVRGPRVLHKVARGLVALAFAVLLLTLGSATRDAEAQLADCEAGYFEVTTAAEFNEAIDCHNTQGSNTGSVEIVLLADIASDIVIGDSVFRPIEAAAILSIDGRGFSISRSATAPTTTLPLLLMVDASGPPFSPATHLFVSDLDIQVGAYDTAGIVQNGENSLTLRAVSITAAPGNYIPIATGIVSNAGDSGQFFFESSLIEGVQIGIEIQTSTYVIERSTIAGYRTDLIFPGNASLGGIFNSTLGGPVGIEFNHGVVDVWNTTILGDGAKPAPGADGVVVFRRSDFVMGCSAPEILTELQPGPGYVNFDRFDANPVSTNYGECFLDPDFVTPLAPLQDNGCEMPTPAGCPRTAALPQGSLAIGKGDCSEASYGDLNRDQRGVLRTPVGPGCDPGSFEYNGCDTEDTGPVGPVQPGPFTFADVTVTTQREFASAIECLNTAPGDADVSITLAATIEADTVLSSGVFGRITHQNDSRLTIYGDGYTLRRNPSAPTSSAPLLSVAENSPTEIEVFDTRLELGSGDTHGIDSAGDGELRVEGSAIVAPVGSTATGIRAESEANRDVLMRGLSIENMRIGLQANGGQIVVSESTFTSSEADVISGDNVTIASIANSTLTAPVGFQFGSGINFVGYSTVLGDGAAFTPESTGFVTFISSIVGSCSAPLATPDSPPGPVAVNESGNVGGCFVPGQAIDMELADNGCIQPGLAFGCTKTVALSADSAAVRAGDCTETDGGLVNTDQRGEPRTPVGLGCDAGAFELDPCSDGIDVFTVGSENELAVALDCFNQGAFGPGDYTLSLTSDITVTRPARHRTIDQASAAYGLVLEGNSNTILVPDSNGIGLGVQGPTAVLTMAATNRAPVTLRNTAMRQSLPVSSDVDYMIWNQSPALVTIQTSSIQAIGLQSGINVDGNSELIVEQSFFELAGAPGINLEAGTLFLSDTTFTNLQPTDFAPAVLAQAGPFSISSSTFDRTPIISDAGGIGFIDTSTFMDRNSSEGSVLGLGEVRILSSILNGCSPTVVDNGSNVGACFGTQVPLDAPADNGCDAPTPTGCPLTVALRPDSPAIGAGNCTDRLTDQRGVPRTPAGPGCDAGSFEAPAALLGDVTGDGAVTNADAQALLVWLAGGVDPVGLTQGDMNDDGFIQLDDALAIAQLVAAG